MEDNRNYLEEIRAIKERDVEVLLKNSYRGIWETAIKKYSEDAHFIRELLQNAEDAGASRVWFELSKEGLWFKHDGKERFTISNPDVEAEEVDALNGTLGHINSITSIGNSNKEAGRLEQQKIGKFGIGFKAVFAYTNTPHIYDNLCFKLENYIVPHEIPVDTQRKEGETLFYFPFNHKEKKPEKAYKEIEDKLKGLIQPILFLPNLKEIEWRSNEHKGGYQKQTKEERDFDDTNTGNWLQTIKQIDNTQEKSELWLFTREVTIGGAENHKISAGFFLDDNGQLKIDEDYNTFCFFPTKQGDRLKLITHAPFLLNDSREGLNSDNINKTLTQKLAKLSADSISYLKKIGFEQESELINDSILRIIPYQAQWNYAGDQYSTFSAYYFKEEMENVLKEQELLPGRNQRYYSSNKAYWASDPDLVEMFSDEQLSALLKEEDIGFVFVSRGQKQLQQADKQLERFIRNLTKEVLDPKKILRRISANFVEQQSDEWLIRFYRYLEERKSLWASNTKKDSVVLTLPILLNQDRKAVAPFQKDLDTPNIFLPSERITQYDTIYAPLMENEVAVCFFKNIGVTKPDLKAEIFKDILPLYESEQIEYSNSKLILEHTTLLFKYYQECPNSEQDTFIDRLKEICFLQATNTHELYFCYPTDVYINSEELKKYFSNTADVSYLDQELYNELMHQEGFKRFLNHLGVAEKPRINVKEYQNPSEGLLEDYGLANYPLSGTYRHLTRVTDKFLDGLDKAIENITLERSVTLWNYLLVDYDLKSLNGEFIYPPARVRNGNTIEVPNAFASAAIRILRESAWIFTNDLQVVCPAKVKLENLHTRYDTFSPPLVKELFELLGIEDNVLNGDLSEQEQQALMLGRQLLKEYNAQSIQALLEELRGDQPSENSGERDEDDALIQALRDHLSEQEKEAERKKLIAGLESSDRYSKEWFILLLQYMRSFNEVKTANQPNRVVAFSAIKQYLIRGELSRYYFVLEAATTVIPQYIEDASNFNITLTFSRRDRKNLKIEGVSKQGQNLLIHIPEGIQKEHVEKLDQVVEVKIEFQPEIDLIGRLLERFEKLDSWTDMNEALPPLNFIYGPPGTGKTTTLSNKLVKAYAQNPNFKALVLVPTNKAGDVLAKRLVEQKDEPNITVARLGKVTDFELDLLDGEVYQDSLDENNIDSFNVIISTIHRLPYFNVSSSKLYNTPHAKWDYLIIDESSMVALPYMIFALMALKQHGFEGQALIAGDPKQIPPVVPQANDQQLEEMAIGDENIYSMLEISSFKESEQEKVRREIDRIDNLTTQYRSVPSIGKLFSEFSYEGLLDHHRSEIPNKKLPSSFLPALHKPIVELDLPLGTDYPVTSVKKLFHSSYHLYAGIFTAELLRHLGECNLEKEHYTIGVISPYKAQAVLTNKLIEAMKLPNELTVYCDTVHGFQGDECDIVIFIVNPTNNSGTVYDRALLNKEYIYNVAVSRAKDYLWILHPNGVAWKNGHIKKLKENVENATVVHCSEVEKKIFGESDFIINNSYQSGHDEINIFSQKDIRYFIKAGATAIDVQISDEVKTSNKPTL